MKIPSKMRRGPLGSGAGNAMLEFAIGAAILTSLFTSAFQYGYIFYQYNVLYSAVSNAAHLGGMYTYSSTNATPDSTWKAAVGNMAVYGNTAGTGSRILPNLTLGTGLNANNSNIQCSIGYIGDTAASPSTFRPTSVTCWVSNYSINGFFASFNANGKPKITYPYQGFFNP